MSDCIARFGMSMSEHTEYMNRCLELSAVARNHGRAAVGALIVNSGRIISEGIEGGPELPPLLAHAEAIAITKAVEALKSRDLSACTIYTTVEPCLLCSFLIRETRISHVVFGTNAGRLGGSSSKFPLLTAVDAGPWQTVPDVTSGVQKEACDEMLKRR